MLTFGNTPSGDSEALSELFGKRPDVIQCGENNDYWIQVRRSKRQIELLSKETGVTKVVAVVGTNPINKIQVPGLSPAQVGAVKDALKL